MPARKIGAVRHLITGRDPALDSSYAPGGAWGINEYPGGFYLDVPSFARDPQTGRLFREGPYRTRAAAERAMEKAQARYPAPPEYYQTDTRDLVAQVKRIKQLSRGR